MTKPKRAQPALPGIGGRGRGGPVARVRRGVDAQLRAQRRLGQLEPVDAALVSLAHTLADALDAEWVDPDGSRFTVGSLSGRLVTVLLHLRGEHAAGEDLDAEHTALVAAIRDATRPGPSDAGT